MPFTSQPRNVAGVTRKKAPKKPPMQAQPQAELTPATRPAPPKMPAQKAPTAEEIRWHNMPFQERLAILSSGKGLPSFIDPETATQRIGFVRRGLGQQSQRKTPLTPATRPKTPKRRK